MKSNDSGTERRRFKRHNLKIKPVAVLGPEPIRVGHLKIISDEAAEIQFSESNGQMATKFKELTIIIPDFNGPYLSEKFHVKTISCSTAPMDLYNENSRMRKCVISLTDIDVVIKRQLKSACL